MNIYLIYFDYLPHIFPFEKGINNVTKATMVQNVRVVTTTLSIGLLLNMEDLDNTLARIVILLQNKSTR